MREPTTRSERSDIITTIVVGVILAVMVVTTTIVRLLDTFTLEGVSVSVPFPAVPADFAPGEGLPIAIVRVTEGDVVAQGVNALSQFSLGASIVVASLAWLTVIACFGVLARRFLEGRFFDPGNPRLLTAASWTMVGGALAVYVLDTLGRNGVLAAAGLGDYIPDSSAVSAPFWLIWIAAVVLGLVALAFRRGIRLQRDSEGLV